MNPIYFIERNIHGAWVVYGLGGIRQYYGYSKVQAQEMYKEEYERKYFVNKAH